MSKYFNYFPRTTYEFANSSFDINKPVVDITLKTRIFDEKLADDPYFYFPYTVREYERAEDVSYEYYGDTKYVWLVYLSNDIVDPYTQWPKNDRDFKNSLIKKYETEAAADGYETREIEWTQTLSTNNNIIHYKSNVTEKLISTDSYEHAQTFNGNFVAGEWDAVRAYEYEFEENESNRNILLLNSKHLKVAEENMKRLLNA